MMGIGEKIIISIVYAEVIVNDRVLIVHSGQMRRKLEDLNIFYNDSIIRNANWEVIVTKAISVSVNEYYVELGKFAEKSINYNKIFFTSFSTNNDNNIVSYPLS